MVLGEVQGRVERVPLPGGPVGQVQGEGGAAVIVPGGRQVARLVVGEGQGVGLAETSVPLLEGQSCLSRMLARRLLQFGHEGGMFRGGQALVQDLMDLG
jgi:hypothetical protein